MLTKNKRYWFDLDAVRVKHSTSSKGYVSYEKAKGKSWHNHKEDETKGAGQKGARCQHPAGKNPGDVWKIATQPFPQAHFATFPEKLIEPMILSSCPKEICKKCGKARARISKRLGVESGKAKDAPTDYVKDFDKGYGVKEGHGFDGMGGGHKRQDWLNRHPYQTIGWTKCECQPQEYEAGIVLDPFMGSGTTAVVAKRLGRNYCGIELSEDYIKIAKQRIRGQTRPIL